MPFPAISHRDLLAAFKEKAKERFPYQEGTSKASWEFLTNTWAVAAMFEVESGETLVDFLRGPIE